MRLRLTVTLCAAALLLVGGVGVLAWPTLVRARVVAVLPGGACVSADLPVRYLGLQVGHVERVESRSTRATVVTLALTRRDLPLTAADRVREAADGAGVEIVRASGPAPALDPRRDTLGSASPAPADPRAEAALRQLRAAGVQFSPPCRR